MLCPRQSISGSTTLVRMPGRAMHDESCPFFYEPCQGAEGAGEGAAVDAANQPLAQTGYALLRKTNDDPIQADRLAPVGSHSRPALPRLGRVLMSLVHHAGLNRCLDGELALPNEQYTAIRTAARDLYMDAGRTIAVNDVLALHPNQMSWLPVRMRDRSWPGSLRPQGLLVCVVDEVDGHDFVAGTRTERVRLTCQSPIRRPGWTREGPYLGCFLAAFDEGGHKLVFYQGYAHPIVSRRWLCPVDSDLERTVAELMADQQRYWCRARGLPTVLTKPLFSLDAFSTVLPDFLLAASADSQRQLVIEVMGMADEAYRTRKARTHEQMAQLGPLVSIESEHLVNDEAIGRLRRRLTAIALSTLKDDE